MNNNLTDGFIGSLWLVFLVSLSTALGIQKTILITFVLIVLLPREVYGFLLGLIVISIQIALMEWLFRYWPITLIVCLVAFLGKDSTPQTYEKSSCKRLS